jgi:hypothetical protein
MVTYFYWALVITAAIGFLVLFGRANQWKAAIILCLVSLVFGWAAYFFHFEQVFVKRFGGVMSITSPQGYMHLGATWKDDNLWIESYEPSSNTCHFNEYSRGNMLQGKVTIKNCNPIEVKHKAASALSN